VVGAGAGTFVEVKQRKESAMKLTRRTLSTLDTRKLRAVVDRAERCWITDVPHLDVLRTAIRRARTAQPAAFPGDVITMNSRFALRNMLTDEWSAYELVYPEEEAVHRNKISVLSSAGMSLLGARVGEEVVWTSSAGPEIALVEKLLHQPEASTRSAAWEPLAVTGTQSALVSRK
jgi:regulator of nucleoside diphosphate kinase